MYHRRGSGFCSETAAVFAGPFSDNSVSNSQSVQRDESDRERFLELLARHEAQLLGFLCAIVPGFQDAEDVFQQTVLTMWQKFDEFEPGTNFVAWGCRIGRNKTMNLLQARRLSYLDHDILDLLLETQEREESEIRQARRRALPDCLSKLGEKDQQLVQAAYSNRQTIKSLAVGLGRSEGGVYNSLARIRAALYRCINAKLAKEGLL